MVHGFPDAYRPSGKRTNPRVQIEVLLDRVEESHLTMRLDEDSPACRVPRTGVKIIRRQPSAIVEMTETKAISYNLV